ncbi:alpha/beta hydrolase [Mycobacterium syngnathidarum]
MVTVNERARTVATEAYGAWHGPDSDIVSQRAGFDNMLPDPAPDVTVAEATVGGVSGRWVEAPGSGSTVALYVHGGGGVLGSSYAYRDLTSRIARAAGARVFVPDYALAPENPYPAGFDDVRSVYSALVTEHGTDPADLVVVGDSAGGGIAVAVVAALAEFDLPRPACVVVVSPFADLTISGESMSTRAEFDPLVTKATAETMSAVYLNGNDPRDPKLSPIFADFTGFPPFLVQVGECEVLFDDSRRLVDAVEAAGGIAEVQVGEGMVHDYHMWPHELPEAEKAIEAIGEFIRTHAR